MQEDRFRRLKAMLTDRANFTAQLSTQSNSKQHADSLSVEGSSSKPLEETGTRSKDILPGSLGLSGKQHLEDTTTAEIGTGASDQEYKQRKRRHENDEEADDTEPDDGEGTYDDDERSDTEAFSEEAETMCSAKEVEYPVVLYINAAGNLVQLIRVTRYKPPRQYIPQH